MADHRPRVLAPRGFSACEQALLRRAAVVRCVVRNVACLSDSEPSGEAYAARCRDVDRRHRRGNRRSAGVVDLRRQPGGESSTPTSSTQIQSAVTQFQHFLTHDLHMKSSSTSSIKKTITDYLTQHSRRSPRARSAGSRPSLRRSPAFVLWFFMTFFLLYDGDNIWAWVVGLFPPRAQAPRRRAPASRRGTGWPDSSAARSSSPWSMPWSRPSR